MNFVEQVQLPPYNYLLTISVTLSRDIKGFHERENFVWEKNIVIEENMSFIINISIQNTAKIPRASQLCFNARH